jgi:hypothetical protein
MAAMYENAYLTIAAAHSRDSNGGLFASSQSISKRLSEHPEHYVTQRLQFPESYPNVWTEETMKKWPLFTRAWAYQERKVSSRILYFASHQVYWECNSRLLSEDGEHNKNFTVGIKSQKNFRRRLPLASWTGNPVEDWKEMITEFSKLALTFETDRLPAIAALAQRMRTFRRYDDTYVAGMWKKSILTDLCWDCIDPDSHKRPLRTGPTWSWASIPGNKVNWPWSKDARLIATVKLLDLSFTSVGPPNVGEVIDASLTLRAPTITVDLTGAICDTSSREWVGDAIVGSFQARLEGHNSRANHPWSIYANLDHDHPFLTPHSVVKALILKRSHESIERYLSGILLRLLPGTVAVYERIGWIIFNYSSYVDSDAEPGDWGLRLRWKKGKRFPLKLGYVWPHEEQIEKLLASLPLEEVTIV